MPSWECGKQITSKPKNDVAAEEGTVPLAEVSATLHSYEHNESALFPVSVSD
jgi:hypothetical protein